MIIGKLSLPHDDFKIGDIIDSEEFDANNTTIVNTINEIIDLINQVDERTEDIFFPDYIRETYIDGVELRSPKITGNTLVGSSGMVGITSAGTDDDSVRIWSGSTNINLAPFKVFQSGKVIMSNADVSGKIVTNGVGQWDSKVEINNDYVKLYNTQLDSAVIDFEGIKLRSSIRYTIGSPTRNSLLNHTSLSFTGETSIGNRNMAYVGIHETRGIGVVGVYDSTSTVAEFKAGGNYVNNLNVGIEPIGGYTTTPFKLRVSNKSFLEYLFVGTAPDFNEYESNSNFIVKGGGCITSSLAIGYHPGITINNSCALNVRGDIDLTGDIYVNGVKMKLTPA